MWISESLPQSDIELGSFHSRNRVQVASDVKPNRTHRSLVPQPHAYRVCVVLNEMANVDCAVDVATVVENRSAQPLFDAERKTQFRIEDEQLAASNRHLEIYARGWVSGVAACGYRALRPGAVDRKTAKSGFTSGKEAFTGGHVAVAESFGQPQRNSVCPDCRAERLVVGTLPQETCEVGAGAQSLGGDSQVQRLIETAASIQGFVTGIANPGGGKRRKPEALVFGQHESRN